MGFFVGEPWHDDDGYVGIRQIVLFIENIWEEAAHDPAEYRLQVRSTLLHEIGHYWGLDEEDLLQRGLE